MATVIILNQGNKSIPLLQVLSVFRNYNVLTSLEEIGEYKDVYRKGNDMVFTVPADVEKEVLRDLVSFGDSIVYRIE